MVDNPEEALEVFFQRIDDWVVSANFLKSKVPVDIAEGILDLTPEEISEAKSEELMTKAFQLYGYIDSLQEVYNKENGIYKYCEDSIWRIITPVIHNYGDQYVKMDFKYNAAVRENPLASKINKLKITTRARLTMMEHRIEHVKKRADILLDIARRRKNEYYQN
jgi:hypothetical protein